jgi:hypothetical protein
MSRPERHGGPILWLLEVLVVLGALLHRGPTHRPPPGVDPDDLAAGYERGDMNPAVVLATAAGLLLTLAIVLVGITTFEAALTGTPFTISRPADLINGLQAAPAPTPPEPRLEAQSGQTLDPYRAAEEQKLNSYGWVDRQAGVARMPIDRAMDLIAQRGLPARPTATATPRDSGSSSPSSASSGRVDEAYP